MRNGGNEKSSHTHVSCFIFVTQITWDATKFVFFTRRVIFQLNYNRFLFTSVLLFTLFSLSSRFVSRMMVVWKEKTTLMCFTRDGREEKSEINSRATTQCVTLEIWVYRCCSKGRREKMSLIYSPETIIFIWRAMNRRKHLHKNGFFMPFKKPWEIFLLSHQN